MSQREILFKRYYRSRESGIVKCDEWGFVRDGVFTPPPLIPYHDLLADCQYTGLKDKNGTKIFEGDVYQPMYGPEFIIKYVDARFVGHNGVSMPDLSTIHYGYRDKGVVVGNIHDNPNILNQES